MKRLTVATAVTKPQQKLTAVTKPRQKLPTKTSSAECRYFKESGRCVHGPICRYAHVANAYSSMTGEEAVPMTCKPKVTTRKPGKAKQRPLGAAIKVGAAIEGG